MIVRVPKVFAPLIENVLVVVLVIVTVENVFPPPANIKPAPVNAIVEVPAVTVSPVETVKFQLVQFTVEEPKSILFVPEPMVVNVRRVIVWSFVSNAPVVRVISLVPLFQVSCTVQPPPEPLNVKAFAVVFPPNVSVFPVLVAANVTAPVYE